MSHFMKVQLSVCFDVLLPIERKKNLVSFDIQLLQQKAEEVQLSFSVPTQNQTCQESLHEVRVWKHKKKTM